MPLNCPHILRRYEAEARRDEKSPGVKVTMNSCGVVFRMSGLKVSFDEKLCERCEGESAPKLKEQAGKVLRAHMVRWGESEGTNMDEHLRRLLELTGDKAECGRLVVEAVRRTKPLEKAKALAEAAKALLIRHGLAQNPS